MEKVHLMVRLVERRAAALAEVARVEQEIGRLVGEVAAEPPAEGGKVPVAGPPTVAGVLDGTEKLAGVAPPKGRKAANGGASLPARLAELLRDNQGKVFSAEEAALALGEPRAKTCYALLRRLARKKDNGFRKAGRGKFSYVGVEVKARPIARGRKARRAS